MPGSGTQRGAIDNRKIGLRVVELLGDSEAEAWKLLSLRRGSYAACREVRRALVLAQLVWSIAAIRLDDQPSTSSRRHGGSDESVSDVD